MNELPQAQLLTQSLAPTPYTVVIDTREQLHYGFAEPLKCPRGHKLCVQTTRGTLPSGDYSLLGFESCVAVERKSLADLYGTLGKGRARFARELGRLASYAFSCVVVEAEFSSVLGAPPARSRLNPRSVIASILAWQQRYIRTHWLFVPGRECGEAVTIRVLDRWWRDWAATQK